MVAELGELCTGEGTGDSRHEVAADPEQAGCDRDRQLRNAGKLSRHFDKVTSCSHHWTHLLQSSDWKVGWDDRWCN